MREVLADMLGRWRLSEPVPLAETHSSVLYRVNRDGHGPAVLKLLKAGSDEDRGGALLAWYGGRGAAAVYELSAEAVLMQWLEALTLGDVARSGRDAEASAILCDVAAELHAERDVSAPELQPLDERFEGLFATRIEDWPVVAGSLVTRAAQIARGLLDSMPEERPLHGDLHHDNILSAEGRWLAIDPKGILGDPAYEFANSYQNPERAAELMFSAERAAKHHAIVAERSGLAPVRLLGWAVAHAALSGAWHVEDGGSPAHQVRMLELLVPMVDA